MSLIAALGRDYRMAAFVLGVVFMSWALLAFVCLAFRACLERKGRGQK